jgi:hypothetical protein
LIPQYDGLVISPFFGEPTTLEASTRSQPMLVSLADDNGGILYQRSQSGPLMHLPANAIVSEVLVPKGPARVIRPVGVANGSLYYLSDDLRFRRVDLASRRDELLLERSELFFSREVPSIATDGTFIAIRHARDPKDCVESSWFEFLQVGETEAMEVPANPYPEDGRCETGPLNWLQLSRGVAYWLEHRTERPAMRSLDLSTGELTDYGMMPDRGEQFVSCSVGCRLPDWARTVMRVTPDGTVTTWDVGFGGMKVGSLSSEPLLTEFEAAAPLGFKPIFPYTTPIYLAEGVKLAP